MAKRTIATIDETIGEAYRASLIEKVPEDKCFPLSQFEKHPEVQKLLAAKPEHQIAFSRWAIPTYLTRFGSPGAVRATPVRVLTDPDRSSKRKMEIYHHFRKLWKLRTYPFSVCLGLHILLKRDLPFTHDDLVYMTDCLVKGKMVVLSCNPFLEGLVKHLQAHVDRHGVTAKLNKAICRLVNVTDVPDQPEDHQKVFRQLKALAAIEPVKKATSKPRKPSSKKPAVKQEPVATRPLTKAEVQAQAQEHYKRLARLRCKSDTLFKRDEVRKALKADPAVLVGVVRLLAEAASQLRQRLPSPVIPPGTSPNDHEANRIAFTYYSLMEGPKWYVNPHKLPEHPEWGLKDYPWRLRHFVRRVLLKSPLPFTTEDFSFILGRMADFEFVSLHAHTFLPPLFDQLQRHAAEQGVTRALAKQMRRLADAMDWPGLMKPGIEGTVAHRRTMTMLRELALLAK